MPFACSFFIFNFKFKIKLKVVKFLFFTNFFFLIYLKYLNLVGHVLG